MTKADLQEQIEALKQENLALRSGAPATSPTKAALPSEVAEKYELVGWVGGNKQRFGRFGVIDLSKLTLTKANSLVKNGFTKLIEKQPTLAS